MNNLVNKRQLSPCRSAKQLCRLVTNLQSCPLLKSFRRSGITYGFAFPHFLVNCGLHFDQIMQMRLIEQRVFFSQPSCSRHLLWCRVSKKAWQQLAPCRGWVCSDNSCLIEQRMHLATSHISSGWIKTAVKKKVKKSINDAPFWSVMMVTIYQEAPPVLRGTMLCLLFSISGGPCFTKSTNY